MLLRTQEYQPLPMRWLCTRRQALAIGLTGIASGVAPAEGGIFDILFQREPSKLVLTFVDVTPSVRAEDWNLYTGTYREAVERLNPGDRVLVGLISDVPIPRFVPHADRVLPRSGVELNDVEAADKIRQELLREFESLKGRRRVRRSYVLDTLNIAQQLIEADGERQTGWIVLLSDMLEDSEDLRLDTLRLDTERIRSIIAQRQERKLLPNLHGAQIFVAGASAPNAEKYQQIREFWLAYFQAANAVCAPGMYGRTVPRFPPAHWRNSASRSSG